MKSKLLIVFLSTLAAMFLSELLLRSSNSLKTYSEKNGEGYISYFDAILPSWYLTLSPQSTIERHTQDFHYSYTSNTLGLRGNEIQPKDDSIYRIIVMGDSYTEGVGAPGNNETMPAYLENALLKNTQQHIEVINAGIAGSDPFHEYVLLRNKLLHLKPNHVLMVVNSSDIDDYFFRGGMERFHTDGTTHYLKGPWFHALYKHSFLYRLLTVTVMGYTKSLVKHQQIDILNTQACMAIAQAADSANKLCSANNCGFSLVIHQRGAEIKKSTRKPSRWQFRPQHNYNLSILKKLVHCQTIDIRQPFEKTLTGNKTEELIWKNDNHFKPDGYQLMASLIADSLVLFNGASVKSVNH